MTTTEVTEGRPATNGATLDQNNSILSELLAAEALALAELGAGTFVRSATEMGAWAVEYALRGWAVFPLRGKVPAIPSPHPRGSRERQTCKRECGQDGHGVLDATTDVDRVIAWWSGEYTGYNIGARIPDPMFMLDVDPRHGGIDTIIELQRQHARLPETLGTQSGRGDGGGHRYFRRPPGRLAVRIGPGIDIKTATGYAVMPPSIHPDTRRPYTRIGPDTVAAPPQWLIDLLRPEPDVPPGARPVRSAPTFSGPSIADNYCASTSWAEVLETHGWTCLDADPDGDGARWRHPTATAPSSASIRNGCLFVYSTSTEFGITEPGNPRGYTRFRAFAVLNHGGDMSAARRALKEAS